MSLYGCIQVVALRDALHESPVSHLDLSYNTVGDTSARALAQLITVSLTAGTKEMHMQHSAV